MANDNSTGNSWDCLLTSILTQKQNFSADRYVFEHELTTMDMLLNRSPGLMNQLNDWANNLNEVRQRSEERSSYYRSLGNNFFRNPRLYQDPLALEFYTKAIFEAPMGSRELALAHANRASVLWRFKFYEEGYFDCQMALENDYPDEKVLKLLKRQKSLAFACKNHQYYTESFNNLVSFMKGREMKPDVIEEAEKSRVPTDIWSVRQVDLANLSLKSKEDKELIENFDQTHGRYLTAKNRIAENEPIIMEQAYAFVPVCSRYELDAIPLHCENCAKTNIIPFPCVACARASYCGPLCRLAHNDIHRFECHGYLINLWRNIGIAHLAVRNLLVGFETTLKGLTGVEHMTPKKFWSALMQRADNDKDYKYGQVLKLCTNFDRMDSSDLLRYALTAAMVIGHLKENTLFLEVNEKVRKSMPHNDWVLLCAALLMRHMGQLVSNGHAISDMEFTMAIEWGECLMLPELKITRGTLSKFVTSTRVFTAIFPKISLINHSCDSNIRNSFDENKLTVFAARSIDENGEILNCYGPNYKMMFRSDRQKALFEQYCFQCSCERCLKDDDILVKYTKCFCQNANCRAVMYLNEKEWSSKSNSTKCPDCELVFNTNLPCLTFIQRNLLLNPSFFTDNLRDPMLKHYAEAAELLNEYHEKRQNFAQIILRSGTPKNKLLCRPYADVALDNLNATRERFGTYSYEFVTAATYVLDFLALMKDRESQWTDDEAEYEALQIFDMDEIRDSFSILSARTKRIFDQYLNAYNL